MPITTAPIFQPPPPPPDSGMRRQEPAPEPYELGWGPLSPEAVFQVRGDPIATADLAARGSNARARSLAGKTDAQITAALEGAPLDPVVVPCST